MGTRRTALLVSVDLETSVFVFAYLYPLIFRSGRIFPCNKKQSWTCICREVLFLRNKESKIMSKQEELLQQFGFGCSHCWARLGRGQPRKE